MLIFIPGRLHLRLPDRSGRPGRQLRRIPEDRRRGLHRHHRHPLHAQGLARNLAQPSARSSSRWSATRPHTLTRNVRRAHRGRRPGAARHLRHQPRRRDQDRRDPRQRHRAATSKELLRKVKAAQYVATHPGEVCPAKWKRRRQDADPVAGPGRQDLSHRRFGTTDGPCRQPATQDRELSTGAGTRAPPDALTKESHHARRQPQGPAQGLPRTRRRADRTGRLARRQPAVAARCASCSTRSPRCSDKITVRDDGNDARAPFVLDQPGRRRHRRALRRHPDGPRVHLAGAGAAAGRRPPAQGRRRRHRADPGARRRLRLRDLHLADLPQLPRRGAGAQPDGGAQPAHPPRDDRRRAVPGRGRRAPDHGRADRVPERRDVRPGPHEHRGDPGQARHRRRGARCREARRQGRLRRAVVGGGPAGAAAAIYAARKGIRTGVVAERFGGQVLDTLGIENFISVQRHRGPEARRRAGAARAQLRRRHHEPAARRRR